MEKEACKRLADAVKFLVKQSSLEQLTVTKIVAEAGVARQTFYRYFRDKYDLVNWCFDQLAKNCFDQMGISCSLRDSLILKFNFIRNEKAFFAEAFKSKDYNSIEQHDYQFILQFYTNLIERHVRTPLDDDLLFLLRMYCHGSISMTVEWALSGMKESSEYLADNLIDALPLKLSRLLNSVL
ncbi:MAG: TetR/AcrR family transcriptional regulator [Treponema sp.]|nr:TetR/AcrR family transcriptional regulator [Treponema sp.]